MAVKDILVIKAENGYGPQFDDDMQHMFIAPHECAYVGGTWTMTRNADGDFSNNKTAAADTTYIYVPLRLWSKATAGRGAKVISIDVVYSIGTLALTSQTPLVEKATFANNAAVVVAAHGGSLTGSLATATQANPYVSTITLGTPAFDVTADADLRMQIAVVAQATSVYKFYGAMVNLYQTSL